MKFSPTSSVRAAVFLAGCNLIACDSSSRPGVEPSANEFTSTTTQALNAVGVLPVPCTPGTSFAWYGSKVQLALRDAMAACGLPEQSESTNPALEYARQDQQIANAYTQSLGILFRLADGSAGVSPTTPWRSIRANPNLNCDPDDVSLKRSVDLPKSFDGSRWTRTEVRWPVQNLCMAQYLRNRPSLDTEQHLVRRIGVRSNRAYGAARTFVLGAEGRRG